MHEGKRILTIPPEKLAYIIETAREFGAEVPSDAEEDSNAADDDEREILLNTPDNPTEQELRDGTLDQDKMETPPLAGPWFRRRAA